MKRLRVFEGGLLRVRDTPEGPFPPNVANPKAACGQEPCYDTGDPRTNQTPMLAGIQVGSPETPPKGLDLFLSVFFKYFFKF